MKKVMVIGAVGSGKTSLLMALDGESGQAPKTQTISYRSLAIDTPGEYIENPCMYRALMSTAVDAECIMFVQDSTKDKSVFPPGFAEAFSCNSIGIITKIDDLKADCELAEKLLKKLCIKGPVYKVSSYTGDGIENLKQYIKLIKKRNEK